jgi:hypothetical protein
MLCQPSNSIQFRSLMCAQDFINDTRALCNSSRLVAADAGGFAMRRGECASVAEAMSLAFVNSWAARLRVCREIASALVACHAAGVLHRDLTSFNVMLSEAQDAAAAAHGGEALSWRETVRLQVVTALSNGLRTHVSAYMTLCCSTSSAL